MILSDYFRLHTKMRIFISVVSCCCQIVRYNVHWCLIVDVNCSIPHLFKYGDQRTRELAFFLYCFGDVGFLCERVIQCRVYRRLCLQFVGCFALIFSLDCEFKLIDLWRCLWKGRFLLATYGGNHRFGDCHTLGLINLDIIGSVQAILRINKLVSRRYKFWQRWSLFLW